MNTTFKYMTFNSSCSYAGLANMLLRYGVDTQDREIARDMKLPFQFAYEEDEYRAGPMLQGAQWFNLYLHPRGLEMRETEVPAQMVGGHKKVILLFAGTAWLRSCRFLLHQFIGNADTLSALSAALVGGFDVDTLDKLSQGVGCHFLQVLVFVCPLNELL